MTPIYLRLEPFLYLYLYGITKTACELVAQEYKSKQAMLDAPTLIAIADIRLKNPQSMVFPKKGKRIALSVSQTVALHNTLQTACDTLSQVPILQLFGIIDKALTDYDPQFSYRYE